MKSFLWSSTVSIRYRSKISIQDLDQSDQIIVEEAVKECLKSATEQNLQLKGKAIKEHLNKKSLNVNALAKEEVFSSREDVEETLNAIGEISKMFATIENEVAAEVAFNIFLKSYKFFKTCR